MISNDAPLTILSTSDLHLGHKKITPDIIAENIRTYIFPRLQHTKLLVIGGDFFDTILTWDVPSNDVIAIIIDLLRECDRWGVVVRILLGTWSHDRTQNSVFPIYHQRYGFTNDLKYHASITCEYIESLGIRTVWLPDNLPYDTSDEAIAIVKKQMADLGWDTVDYVFCHGYFEHVLPPKAHQSFVYRIEQFKPWVTRRVVSGHVHTGSIYDIVIYNGSFERLCFGEEERKGFIFITDYGIDENGTANAKIEFVENLGATKFLTFDLSNCKDAETAEKQLHKKMKPHSPTGGGYIKIIHNNPETRIYLAQIIALQYSSWNCTHEPSNDAEKKDLVSKRSLDLCEYPKPTPDNLPEMIVSYLETDPILKDLHMTVSDVIEVLAA